MLFLLIIGESRKLLVFLLSREFFQITLLPVFTPDLPERRTIKNTLLSSLEAKRFKDVKALMNSTVSRPTVVRS